MKSKLGSEFFECLLNLSGDNGSVLLHFFGLLFMSNIG